MIDLPSLASFVTHSLTSPWVGLVVLGVAVLPFAYIRHRQLWDERNRLWDERNRVRLKLDGMNIALDKAAAKILRMEKGGKALFDENQRLQVQLVNAHFELGRLQNIISAYADPPSGLSD